MAGSSSSTAKMSGGAWFVYVLECKNGRLYTGITTDLVRRFRQHCLGKGAMFTRLNPPLRMLAAQPCLTRSEAGKLEYQIKQFSVIKKRAVVKDWQMLTGLPDRTILASPKKA